MPQERLSMHKIREVLRLKFDCGLSHRAAARSCAISHSTVVEYVHRAQAVHLGWPLPDGLSDEELFRRLYPQPPRPTTRSIPEPDWLSIRTELAGKGVTLRLLWVEYREQCPDGYAYSQFCELYRRFAKRLSPSMRFNHQAGEAMFIDYAGATVLIIDPQSGEIRQAQVFVAVLGASSYTWADATWSQGLSDFIGSQQRALAYFHGVPEIIVPDNLRTGVQRANRYEPDLNPTYLHFAQHYGVAVIPARVRKPKDKAKVEAGVLLVERWILARLRHRRFFSLAELNAEIRRLLEDLNTRPMRLLRQSRRERFEALDRPALKPLPDSPYEFAVYKNAIVNIDYHVAFDNHFYSVPYALSRRQVEIRATEQTVEVYYQRLRVASHLRSRTPGRFSTLPEHMPEAHRRHLEWTPERLINWAEKVGPQAGRFIQGALAARVHPQQAFRTCLGVLSLSKSYGDQRVEGACARALDCGIASYKGLKNILDAKLDQAPAQETPTLPLPAHANIRGQAYYR